MSVFEFDGLLIEVTEFFGADSDSIVFECWNVTPNSGGGLLFTIEDSSRGLIVQSMQSGVQVALILKVAELISA